MASTAHATESHARRVALVIGNGDYRQPTLTKLLNPPNDARDLAKVLRNLGFEVIERRDQTLEGMSKAIAEFGHRIGGAEAALFYYAGHGIQVRSQNYLIPVNASLESEAAVPFQSINVNQILEEMDTAGSAANIVILDACRNNPLTGLFRSAQARGLASPGPVPRGTVIVYATEPGSVAADGRGRNGLFTAGLLKALAGKDLSLDTVLTVTSAEVEQASDHLQTPYVNGPKTLQKNFQFRVTVDPGRDEIERSFWSSVEWSTNPADFEAYLRQYPDGHYAALAVNRLKEIRADRPAEWAAASKAFDGHWAVAIDCDEVREGGKSTKGYHLNLFVDVADDRIKGQFGPMGQAGSLTMVGTVQGDGTAELFVTGLTGNPDITVGHLPRSTPYSYRMRGMLEKDGGLATRTEVRPCKATFVRQ
jgi:hypothetical protein